MRISDWSSDVCSSDLASCHRAAELGWLRGLEPPTSGITIQDSNQLSYSHHLKRFGRPVPWAFRRHPGRGCPCSDAAAKPGGPGGMARPAGLEPATTGLERSEEHTSELQSLMRISYAVFCLKKNNNQYTPHEHNAEHGT